MSNYYVSGCVADGDDVSVCDDSVAQFWTLYHRNEEGLSEGIIDCMFREDAETAMRAYEERDALAADNAALKVICNDRRVFIMNGVQLGYIKVPTVEADPALETIRIAVSPQEPTPATDAYLNSVRAEGIQMLLNKYAPHTIASSEASECARQLRAGEPS